jgi:hypothetical protein
MGKIESNAIGGVMDQQVQEQRLDGRGYAMPRDGWTCFHCGETFDTWGSAQDHFGETQCSTPACQIKLGDERGLVMELRKFEKQANGQIVRDLVAMLKRESVGYRAKCDCKWCKEVLALIERAENSATGV